MTREESLNLFQKSSRVDVSWDDARLADLEEVLGFNVRELSIMDLEEIKARQAIFAYLLENLEDFQQVFAHWERAGNFTVPTDSINYFLSYQQNLAEKNTEFWSWLEHKLLPNLPDKDNLPLRLAQVLEVIESEKDDYLQEEVELTEAMTDDLSRSVVIEGIVVLNTSQPGHRDRKLSLSEQVCCGVNLYLTDPEKVYQPYQPPKWLGSLGRYYAQRVNKRKEKQQYKGFQIENIPAPIMQDILNHFAKIFQSREDYFKDFSHLTLEVYYVYDKNGLRVRVLDCRYSAIGFITHNKRDADPPHFMGLENTLHAKAITNRLVRARNFFEKEKRHAQLKSRLEVYYNLKNINDSHTSAHYSPMVFAEVVSKYQAHLDLVNNWHQKVMALFKELYGYYQVISKIKSIASANNLYLTMPEVLDQGNVLEVSEFAPVRLSNKKRIKRFSQFSVNGKMLNLTGRNGSGKTTVLLAILDLCLMAQAGLPVFAQKAKLSIKKYFLLSFLERVSDDSTFKAKLRKDMDVVTKIKNLLPPERKNVLAIVDELGSATTQVSVMSVVKPFADWLGQIGVSAVLSTQMPELSQYMADNLGVKNFKITTDFDLEEGIGEGEPDEVAKEMGFFELLAQQ